MLISCVKLDHALYSINYGGPTNDPLPFFPGRGREAYSIVKPI